MTTAELLDTLGEAARYVRTAPDEAARLAAVAALHMGKRSCGPEIGGTWGRLAHNILAGIRWRLVEPDVFAGYLLGARFEIQAREGA